MAEYTYTQVVTEYNVLWHFQNKKKLIWFSSRTELSSIGYFYAEGYFTNGWAIFKPALTQIFDEILLAVWLTANKYRSPIFRLIFFSNWGNWN